MPLIQHQLEHHLIRCRYLLTQCVTEKSEYNNRSKIQKNVFSFMRECFIANKEAQEILTADMMALEDAIVALEPDISDISKKEQRKYIYWLRVFELFFDTFVWLFSGLDRSSVTKVYKGPKHGKLRDRNVKSVLRLAQQFNAETSVFAIPLDFSRFECICDLLKMDITSDKFTPGFYEVKEGRVNEAIMDTIQSKQKGEYYKLFDTFGMAGIKQMERIFKQRKVMDAQLKVFQVKPGIYEEEGVSRHIIEPKTIEEHYTEGVEELIRRDMDNQYAVNTFDGFLMVAGLNTSNQDRYIRDDFLSRMFVQDLFINPGGSDPVNPEQYISELKKIKLIDWRTGRGSIYLRPPVLSKLSAKSLMDLLFGRVILVHYFDYPSFVRLCRDFGVKAGFLSKKWTNRLKGSGQARGYPQYKNRLIGYMAGSIPMVMGDNWIHEMVYNWLRPVSVVLHLAEMEARMKEIGEFDPLEKEAGFSEKDLDVF